MEAKIRFERPRCANPKCREKVARQGSYCSRFCKEIHEKGYKDVSEVKTANKEFTIYSPFI